MQNDDVKRQLRARGICVVIPTYNNGKTIGQVVRDCLLYCDDVIVVNDGCTDDTAAVLDAIDAVTVVTHTANNGKGCALKTGFREALKRGFAYAITLDGDGQHYASDIPLLLQANKQHPGALIVGKRQLEGVDRSKGSSFANKFANFWFYVQTGRALEDTQTGYRLYPLHKLHGLSLLTSRYEAELELLVFASWHGVKIVSIPVHVYYPPREERVSHFRPGKDFARISVLNTVLCFLAVVYGLPLRLCRFLMIVLRTVYSLLFFITIMSLVITPLTWLYVKLSARSEKQRYRLHQLLYHSARFVMLHHGIPGTKFRCKTQADINFDKPRIIISNHQSHLDLMCLLVFTPKVVVLTNSWVWNNPFYGILIRNAEYLPVTNGIDAILPQLRSLTERGYSVLVFPEGTRSHDCSIMRFHSGAFYLAQKLHLDILPMYLYGPGKVLPKKSRHLHKGLLYVEVDRPITPEEMAKIGDVRTQTKHMRHHYIEKYEAISNQIEQHV